MASSILAAAARGLYLLDLLAQLPGPRKRRGRRHSLAGLLAVGIAEDKSLVRTANAARVMAWLRSLAISVLRLDGQANIAAAHRHHACGPQRTLKLLQTA